MTLLKLSEDGKVALPEEMRVSLSLKSGDEVEAKVEGNSIRLMPTTSSDRPRGKGVDIGPWIGAAKGSFGSVEEIDEYIRKERDAWD